MEYCILVVNPGSTSTKIAVFQGEKALLQKTIRHSGEELAPFGAIMDQAPFRLRCVEQALAGFDLTRLDAVCARGGMLPACPSGAFAVDQDMIGYLSAITQGAHASNLGCVMARDLAEPLHIPAYVYDPVAVDEMPPMARITGIPELPRRMMGHALNTRAMAIRCAETVLHKPFDQCRLIVLHLGGGASVRLFIGGKMVDNVRDDELLFAPERSGGIAAEQLVKLCYSGKYDRGQMMKLVRGKSGLLAHLGTSDAMEVERRIAAGDEKARMVYDAMLYTAAKSIGALAAAADGRIDRIILTGGIAHSRYVTDYLTQKVGFIAPVEVMAGEFEMEALAAGASRVLAGQETPHRFRDLLNDSFLWELLAVFALQLAAMVMTFAFPLMARYENTWRNHLKNAMLVAVGHLPRMLLIWAVWAVPVGVSVFIPEVGFYLSIVWVLIGYSSLSYVTALLLRPVFRNLEENA